MLFRSVDRRVRVFSEERQTIDGARCVWTFFATDYATLWRRQSALKFKNVHCYEIIEEDQPCHLYFDLEFQKEFNEGLDGNALVTFLLKQLEWVLRRRWRITLQESFVMEMDASTETKFSRHLIIRFKQQAFRNNAQIKPLIREILHNSAPGQFSVNKSDGKSCFIDESVYSK